MSKYITDSETEGECYARIAALEKELAERKDYDDEREKVLAAIKADFLPFQETAERLMDANERLEKELAATVKIIPDIVEKNKRLKTDNKRLRAELEQRPYWLWRAMLQDMATMGCGDSSVLCSESGDCITEWCTACGAEYYLADIERREALDRGKKGKS